MAVARRLLSKPIHIRSMQATDAQPLLRLVNSVVAEKQFLRAQEPYRLDAIVSFLGFLSNTNNIMLVAEYDSNLVAWLDIIAAQDTPQKGVLGMGVAKAYRDQQIGRQLMQEAFRRAVGSLTQVQLQVYQHNQVAITLYRRFGFVEIGCQSGILTMSKDVPESYYPSC